MAHLTLVILILQLSLSNFALPVEPTCHVNGSTIYNAGDQLELICASTVGNRIDWTLESKQKQQIKDGNGTSIRIENNTYSILTKDIVTLKDSGIYQCQCGNDDKNRYHVFVFEASLHASVGDGCEVAIILTMTAVDKMFSLTSFRCPTLQQKTSKIWNFSDIRNHGEEHKIYMLAVGDSDGHKNQTCNFTVEYRPNGVSYKKNFTKTVALPEEGECNKQTADAPESNAQQQPTNVGSRAMHRNRLLTATLVALACIYHSLK